MPTGLYPNYEVIERSLGTVATGAIAGSTFLCPYDADVVGMALYLGTAPGGATTLTVNITSVLTSQQGGVGANPNPTIPAPGLWTAANVPSITGTAKMYPAVSQPQVVNNVPYSLNYPLPGPGGTQGFVTAQQTTLYTTTPVLAPPQVYKYQLASYVPPDNTYTDMNGVAGTPASFVHAGDVLTWVVGGAAGSAANLLIEFMLAKR